MKDSLFIANNGNLQTEFDQKITKFSPHLALFGEISKFISFIGFAIRHPIQAFYQF